MCPLDYIQCTTVYPYIHVKMTMWFSLTYYCFIIDDEFGWFEQKIRLGGVMKPDTNTNYA